MHKILHFQCILVCTVGGKGLVFLHPGWGECTATILTFKNLSEVLSLERFPDSSVHILYMHHSHTVLCTHTARVYRVCGGKCTLYVKLLYWGFLVILP